MNCYHIFSNSEAIIKNSIANIENLIEIPTITNNLNVNKNSFILLKNKILNRFNNLENNNNNNNNEEAFIELINSFLFILTNTFFNIKNNYLNETININNHDQINDNYLNLFCNLLIETKNEIINQNKVIDETILAKLNLLKVYIIIGNYTIDNLNIILSLPNNNNNKTNLIDQLNQITTYKSKIIQNFENTIEYIQNKINDSFKKQNFNFNFNQVCCNFFFN